MSTPNMTGRDFHRTTEAIPRRPRKARSPLSTKKGTRGLPTRYDTVLLPFIFVRQYPGRPVIPVPDDVTSHERFLCVMFVPRKCCCWCRAGTQITLQSEILAKLIPKTVFCVAEMRFSKKIIPKQFCHVILWITNEYVWCNFWEINSRNKICN